MIDSPSRWSLAGLGCCPGCSRTTWRLFGLLRWCRVRVVEAWAGEFWLLSCMKYLKVRLVSSWPGWCILFFWKVTWSCLGSFPIGIFPTKRNLAPSMWIQPQVGARILYRIQSLIHLDWDFFLEQVLLLLQAVWHCPGVGPECLSCLLWILGLGVGGSWLPIVSIP